MDLSSMSQYSPQVMKVIETFRTDPDFLTKFKANPQDALNEIGVELDEKEMAVLQKIESFQELGGEVSSFVEKVKQFFGLK